MSETQVAPPADGEQEQPPPEETKAVQKAPTEAARRTMALPVNESGRVVVTLFQEQWDMAAAMYGAGVLGPGIKSVAQAWAVMQRGAELGFAPMTALEFLYIVKGRIRLTPDGAKAKAQSSGLLEDFKEYFEGVPGEDSFKAVCWIKRRGTPTPIVREFSIEDAKAAKLWMKKSEFGESAWVTYYKRMLAARARGFGFGDGFRDVIGGLPIREVFDLDRGEYLGASPAEERALSPGAHQIAPTAPAKPAKVSFSAPLVVDEVEAQVVETKTPATNACDECDPSFSCFDGSASCRKAPAPPVEPATWDEASGQAKLRSECQKRTGGDAAACGDLFREIIEGVGGLETEEQYDHAMAAIRQHPVFGDEPPVLTSPKTRGKK